MSDYAVRRVKALSLPIVLGSTFELDDSKHGARLHEKAEAPYADGDGYVYARWGSPTNEGAARQVSWRGVFCRRGLGGKGSGREGREKGQGSPLGRGEDTPGHVWRERRGEERLP